MRSDEKRRDDPRTGTTIAPRDGEKERLAAALEGTKAELASTLDELKGAMRHELDWRAWVSRRPIVAVALAAFIGFRLARGRRR